MRKAVFSMVRRFSGWALAGGLLASATLSAAQTGANPEGILVYNAQHVSLTQAWAQAFTAETGINRVFYSDEDWMFRKTSFL